MKNLYLFAGPSGVGKSAIVDALSKAYGCNQVKSFTDRPKRAQDEAGHIFLSKTKFDELNDVIAPVTRYGHRYGITKEILDASDMYVIELDGIQCLLESYSDRPIKVIGINAPFEMLRDRMKQRGDSDDSINQRLLQDSTWFRNMEDFCDVIFMNKGTLSDTVAAIMCYIDHLEKPYNSNRRSFLVETPLGRLYASAKHAGKDIPDDYPGVFIELIESGKEQPCEVLVTVEHEPYKGCLQTVVYSNAPDTAEGDEPSHILEFPSTKRGTDKPNPIIKIIEGESCKCYEYGNSGKMRLQLSGSFSDGSERESYILVPIELEENCLATIEDLWLNEQERELGLSVGESCTSSSWWVGSDDSSNDDKLTDKYDNLIALALTMKKDER